MKIIEMELLRLEKHIPIKDYEKVLLDTWNHAEELNPMDKNKYTAINGGKHEKIINTFIDRVNDRIEYYYRSLDRAYMDKIEKYKKDLIAHGAPEKRIQEIDFTPDLQNIKGIKRIKALKFIVELIEDNIKKHNGGINAANKTFS